MGGIGRNRGRSDRRQPWPRSSARVIASGEEPVMGSSGVRERIAIVFMTLSLVATLVLGGALAAQLGHPRDQVVQVGAASATSSDGGVSPGDQSASAAGVGSSETTDTTAAGSGGSSAGSGSGGTATAAGGQSPAGQATSGAA